MKRKTDRLAEYHEEIRDVGASLIGAVEKIGGPAVLLFCGVAADQGTTTIATAVSRAIAGSGTRTVLATNQAHAGGVPAPSHALQEVVEAGGKISFDESRWARLIVPGQFLDFPEAARDPRTWLKTFDLLIVDAPPLAEFSTRYWVPRTDGVVLVVDGEKSGTAAVVQARGDIVRLGGTLTGVVLNRYRSGVPSYLR